MELRELLTIREVRDAPHRIIIAGITKSFIGGYWMQILSGDVIFIEDFTDSVCRKVGCD